MTHITGTTVERHSPVKRRYGLVLASILLISFGLRAYQLGHQSLRGDEGSTYIFSTEALAELLKLLKTTEFHPPLYYSLMHGWLSLAGHTEYALRFTSAIIGVLLVASVATLGRMLLDYRLGLVTALFVGLNPYHILYAQDARSYPLATLLGVLSTMVLWKALRNGRWRDWVGYAALVLAAIYTHYYAALIIVFQGLFVSWYSWQRRRFVWQYLAVGLIDGLLFLPWLLAIWKLFVSYKGYGESVGILGALWRPLQAFAGGQFLQSGVAWVNAIVFLPLICLGALGIWRAQPQTAILASLYLLVPLVGVYLASLFKPVFDERYLILASPAFYLLAGGGLVWLLLLRRTSFAVVALLLGATLLATQVWGVSNYYFNPQFAKSPPWRDVMDYIARKAHPGDALIYTAPLPTILFYNQEHIPAYLVIPRGAETSLPEAVTEIEKVFEDHGRVWLVPAAPSHWQAAHQTEPWLDRHSVRLDQTFFRVVHIGLYESPAMFFEAMTPQPARFEDGIQLTGFRLPGGESRLSLSKEDSIPLTLAWIAESTPTKAYTVFTHLVGPDGMLWGQWDNPPVWGSYPTSEWATGEIVFDQYLIPIKKGAPPGEYRLRIGLYDPVTGTRLPTLDDTGKPSGDYIQLELEIVVQ
jgi:uncharacterized membrane protein